MAYVKTSSGVIEAEDTWAAKPAWMDEVQDAPGRITYPLDGTVVIETVAAAQAAYLVYNTALADADEWVVRIKVKDATGGNYGIYPATMCDAAVVPAAPYNATAPPYRSMIRFNAGIGWGVTDVISYPESFAATLWNGGAFAYDTYYVFEIVHGAVQDTLQYMLATDLTVYLETDAYNHAYTNDPFFVVGDPGTDYFAGEMVVDYLLILESLDVEITDIANGHVVKLYDGGDVLRATSAAAGGGSAIMDCSQVDFTGTGFTGYFKVFDGAVEQRRLPAAGNFTGEELFGGDVWPGVLPGPTVTLVAPDSGQVGDTIIITGTNFGAVQGASTVTFDGIDAGTAISWSDISITIKVPVGATTGDIIVTVAGLPSAGDAFIVLPPDINTLVPSHGRVGTRVVVMSKYLGATQATFGYAVEFHDGVAVVDYISWSDSEIVCLVPEGAATGEVVVV